MSFVGEGYEHADGFVLPSREFRRISKLPRGDWREGIEGLIELLGLEYGKGTQRLRPIQAATLAALHDHHGAFGAIGVGEGKTLISYLAPVVIEANRPLLLVPAKLITKTQRDFETLSEHWRGSDDYKILSYEKLGRISGADEIESYSPDLLVLDEAHRAKNPRAACTRRIIRYLLEQPGCALLAMSGTASTRSLLDFAHFLLLALGNKDTPLPTKRKELETWAAAVDEKTDTRALPGAFRKWLAPGELPSLNNVRKAVGRRIFETPGVLQTTRKSVEASIVVEIVKPKLPGKVKRLIRRMIDDKIAPNGDEVLPVDLYRHTRTLVQGFYYMWDPPPPRPWLEARKRWRRFVADVISREDPRFDSEEQVARSCARRRKLITRDTWRGDREEHLLDSERLRLKVERELDSAGAWEAWKEVRQEYKINSVPVWVSEKVLGEIELEEPTIVWVEHQAAGEKLSEIIGLPYYHRQGLCGSAFIDDHDPNESLIASIGSNSEGRNLQAWSSNFVLLPPTDGGTWEQVIGRTHRQGQTADEVKFKIQVGHSLIKQQLQQAIQDAKYVHSVTGAPQKLLLSNIEAEL